jgi:hypothetical protein
LINVCTSPPEASAPSPQPSHNLTCLHLSRVCRRRRADWDRTDSRVVWDRGLLAHTLLPFPIPNHTHDLSPSPFFLNGTRAHTNCVCVLAFSEACSRRVEIVCHRLHHPEAAPPPSSWLPQRGPRGGTRQCTSESPTREWNIAR